MNPQLRKLVLDFGPLMIFFAAYRWYGIYVATGVLMAAVTVALAIGYSFERKIPRMPLFTAVLVLIFGGLTLYLQDETFLKMKVTLLYGFFGIVLLGGLPMNRLYIKYVFAEAFDLNDAGWKKLTLRWGIFFLGLAALNEAIWRNFSTDIWVDFKVWGIVPLILLFTLSQLPLMLRHAQGEKTSP